jgi:hypothetical protein
MRGFHEEKLRESVECTVKITFSICDFGRSPCEHAEDRMCEYYSEVGAGVVRFQLRADSADQDERNNAHRENRWALEDLSAGS